MSDIKKIGILTDKESWFLPYAKSMIDYLAWFGFTANLYLHHKDIDRGFDVLFILSYFRKVPKEYLLKNRYNLVVHESDLPQGKGWAPLFWQILEGKNKIPVVLIEASDKIDSGKIYIKDYIELEGHELHNEIREKQAKKTIELCIRFLRTYKNINPYEQKGRESFYRKRKPEDHELDVDKTIREQFNLLRISDNERYPAFFVLNGYKYIVKIYKEEVENENKRF